MTRRGLAAGLAATMLCVLAVSALAHSYKLGEIAIGHVWSPPPTSDATGIPVYGPLLSQGSGAARLVGASSPIADEARFRIEEDGEVTWPDHIELQPGKPLALAAWRQHIWLSGLHERPRAGDTFELTLDFSEAGTITVEVMVEGAAGH